MHRRIVIPIPVISPGQGGWKKVGRYSGKTTRMEKDSKDEERDGCDSRSVKSHSGIDHRFEA
jgi:hypothetical protein